MSTKLAIIIADFETQLATQIDVAGTTGTLQSYADDDGVNLPNGTYFFTLDKDNSVKEHIVCTLTAGVMSAIKSVSRQGVQTVGVLRKHRIGASVTITDFAHIKYMNDLLSGTTNLNSLVPLAYDGDPGLISSDLYSLATVDYVNNVAIAGAPDASTTVKGIVELATQAEADARTTTGGTGAKLVLTPDVVRSTLISDYKVDTGAADAYVITPIPAITAYTVGQIFSFKAANTNTTASTLNVSGLGVKTIKKGAGATDLAAGDIVAGMIVLVEYNATSGFFQMLNPVANAPTTAHPSADVQVFSTPGSTSWTKPSGAKWVEVTVIGSGAGGVAGNTGAGGGGGGGYGFQRFNASALGSTETVLVGAGGASNANGNPSAFGTTVLLRATGGAVGSGSTGGTGGSANGSIHYSGGAGGSNGGQGTDTATDPSPRGGGAAGYDGGTPNNAVAGGTGGSFITNYVKQGALGGTTAGTVGGAAATTNTGLLYGGVGGGGGGRAVNGSVIGGGGAGNLGSGGGGGGVTNGGGAGGDGCVIVVTYF